MLDSFGGRLETEEAASIHSHEQTRAARIGALGNHQVAQENNKILDAENPKLRSPKFLLFFHIMVTVPKCSFQSSIEEIFQFSMRLPPPFNDLQWPQSCLNQYQCASGL